MKHTSEQSWTTNKAVYSEFHTTLRTLIPLGKLRRYNSRGKEARKVGWDQFKEELEASKSGSDWCFTRSSHLIFRKFRLITVGNDVNSIITPCSTLKMATISLTRLPSESGADICSP